MLEFLDLERFKSLKTVSIEISKNQHILKVLRGDFSELIVNYNFPSWFDYEKIGFKSLKIDPSKFKNEMWKIKSD